MMVLRVKGWSDLFESYKSKGFKNKTQTYMPNKNGVGYKYLVTAENGWALYGVWCAMVCWLSRMPKPREGYLTDTSRPDGIPMDAQDIAVAILAPLPLVEAMLDRCKSEKVAWLEEVQVRAAQSTHPEIATTHPEPPKQGALPSPSPSPLPLHPLPPAGNDEEGAFSCGSVEDMKAWLQQLHTAPQLASITLEQLDLALGKQSPFMDRTAALAHVCDRAALEGRVRKPLVFLDLQLGYYAKNNAAAIQRKATAAGSRARDLEALASFIIEGGLTPQSVDNAKRDHAKHYGHGFVAEAEALAESIRGTTCAI